MPADLEALYAIEREIPAVDPSEAARTLSAVNAAIAAKSAGAVVGAAAGYTLKHMVTVAGLAFAGGVVTYGVIDRALEERSSVVEPLPTSVATPPESADAGLEMSSDAGVMEIPLLAIVDAGVTRAPVASREPDAIDHTAAERRLLDAARFAAARGDVDSALSSLAEHRARFRQGSLGEERDAMQIHLLVRTGRIEEARSAADRFRTRYPRSLLLRSIEQAIEP